MVEPGRLRAARLAAGMAQADLAAAAGVAKSTVAWIETGKHRARPSTARKLAKALGVKVADLVAVDAAEQGEGR